MAILPEIKENECAKERYPLSKAKIIGLLLRCNVETVQDKMLALLSNRKPHMHGLSIGIRMSDLE